MSVLRILPTGMCFLSALYSIFIFSFDFCNWIIYSPFEKCIARNLRQTN